MLPVRHALQRTLEFGIYRDGDNNLDESQSEVIDQAQLVSGRDGSIQFSVEDTGFDDNDDRLKTQRYTMQDGSDPRFDPNAKGADMAAERTLAWFVAYTLDNAEKSGARQTWIDLVDHGAGDGGGLEADTFGRQIMPMPQMAQAIADGVKLHAQHHPEDAGRGVDGVLANQCLMASLGFADALSHAGVKYLAASPETMVSPGAPSTIAHDIAQHARDPQGTAQAIVDDAMHFRYGIGSFSYTPCAAFDVLDLNRTKMSAVEASVKSLNDTIASLDTSGAQAQALRDDAAKVKGMARIPDATPDMPWHADRPAIALYETIASDGRLDQTLRSAARIASHAVSNMVLAHGESTAYAPFNDANYRDAVGPTVHFPVNAKQVDRWAPRISETSNRFFNETDAAAAERVLA